MRARHDRRRFHRSRAGGLVGLLCTGALSLLVPQAAAQQPAGATPSGSEACSASTGPYQRQLEEFLKRPADGRQSPQDCAAIRDFQRTHQLGRQDGYAGLETYRQTQIVRAGTHPNADGSCPVDVGRVVCVDMTRQFLWLQNGKKLEYGPVATRTGRWGEETRPGMHKIFRRVRDDYSQLFDNAPMPYAQYFDGGQAIHGRYDDLFDGSGSAGCVNLSLKDAKVLWDRLGIGAPVFVWGRKPGT
ncbi:MULTISPECIES: L,D-transpeptidase family protein [unclassified Streptomyces]|uniref:L,D-transpeptidase family protein n=1 Tax=unclassified Streptomyces TaxID=2593676 RepID=UPI0036E6D50B